MSTRSELLASLSNQGGATPVGGNATPPATNQREAMLKDVTAPWEWSANSTGAFDPNGDRVSQFISQHRDVLYGGSIGGKSNLPLSAENLAKWDGSFNARDKVRVQVGQNNVKLVQGLLRQMYPDATEAQLDQAALAAIQEDNTRQQIWYGKYRTVNRQGGYGWDVQDNPLSIVRAIGSHMEGGITPEMSTYLDGIEPKVLAYMKKAERAIDRNDSSHQGLTGIINDMGIVADILSIVPVTAPYMLAAKAAAGLEDGKIDGIDVANGIGSYLGFTAPAPTGAATLEGAATNAVKQIPMKAGMQYLATGQINPRSLALSTITSAGANYAIGNNIDPNIAQTGAGLINRYGARELSNGLPSTSNTKPQSSTNQPRPQTQPSGWGRMPGVSVSRSDMLNTLKGG